MDKSVRTYAGRLNHANATQTGMSGYLKLKTVMPVSTSAT
jgi:hypothetical protein